MEPVTEKQDKVVRDVLTLIYKNDVPLEERYAEVAENYDEMMTYIRAQVHSKITQKLGECFKNTDLASKYIIDIGSGTGVLGKEMKSAGFSIIDALDMSKEMMEISKKSNLYKNYFNIPLTESPTPNIENDTYDAAVSSGCFLEGHMSMSVLTEIIRMVRSGGFIVLSISDKNLKLNFMSSLEKYMQERKIELMSLMFEPYIQDFTNNYEYKYAYYMVCKVL